MENVKLAINHIWPLVYNYRMDDGDAITARDVRATQMCVMSGDNTRISIYNKKRKKAVRMRRGLMDEDSDGENWSDSSDEEGGVQEELEMEEEDEEEEF